ncbi:MAG: Rieske 2Fe-2S domain-containing protein [Pseudomonadota bacterium]
MTHLDDAPAATADRVWPAEGETRVPYWIYSDPAIYARELERIFEGPTWSYLALDCELPAPGAFKRSTIGETSVLLVRDADGVVRGFLNQCAHRGVELCQLHRGNAAELICPYHQWTYALDGQLIGVRSGAASKARAACPRISRLRRTASSRSG